MGFFDFLTGSDPTFQDRTFDTLTPEERGLQTGTLFPTLRKPRGTVDLSSLEQTSLAGLEQLALQSAEGASPAAKLSRTSGTQLQDILTRGPEDFDEFFRTTVQEPSLREFEENVLPRIARRFSGGNFFGSERFEADTRAREDLLQSLTETRGRLGFESRQQDVENILRSIGLVGEATSGPMGELIALLAAGQVPRGVELDRLASQDIRVKQIIEALGLGTVENTVLTTPGQTGIFGDIASSVGTIAVGKAFGL